MAMREQKKAVVKGAAKKVVVKKTQEDVKGKKKQAVEEEEDEDLLADDEEDEEEEEQEVKPVKAVKSTKKVQEEDDEEEEDEEEEQSEDEEGDLWGDDLLNPEEGKQLMTNPELIPEGVYTAEIVDVRTMPAKGEMAAVLRPVFKILTWPDDVDEPETGWPQVTTRFRKWASPKDWQVTAQRIDKTMLYRLVNAALGGLPKKAMKPVDLLKKCIGHKIQFQPKHTPDSNDPTVIYQDLVGWQPVEDDND